jgi:hypothetical protein
MAIFGLARRELSPHLKYIARTWLAHPFLRPGGPTRRRRARWDFPIDFGRQFRQVIVYMSQQDDILAANAAYYEAFASADFGKMSHIWADDEVTCVHTPSR